MLRHKGVFGEMGAVDRSKEQLAVLRKYSAPAVVEFRRGGDLDKVVQVVKSNSFVEIQAAVGAGKSTEIPLLLAKAMGCLVVHTIPFSIAAQYLADYLGSREVDGNKFVYMDDLEADMPIDGVVLMSTPFFHARRAKDAFRGVKNAILYLDESHESDGWTASLRTLAPTIQSFRVVKASATSAPTMQLTPDLPSKVQRLTYRKGSVQSWSATDRGVPWAASSIQGNVMICIDRVSTRCELAAQYEDYGFIVRDCSDQDYAYFRETVRLLKDPREGIVVVLVDYKFRSSFSIPGVSTFIDSCEVAVPVVIDGLPKIKYRPAYDFEVQQFLGRGGRIAGVPAKLYRSEEASRRAMCDLESLECDAANLLYRLMGFRPPIEYADYDYYRGNVPADIAAAMASSQPLRLYPEESRVPWVNGHKALIEEDQKAAFQYELTVARKAKTVSCHTVADVTDRPKSPPPPVPRLHRSTYVHPDGLESYRSSRESSPSAVFTLDTEIYDNVSAARDASAERPKRIAKRYRDAYAAEAIIAERRRDEDGNGERSLQIEKRADVPIAVGESARDLGKPVIEHSLARKPSEAALSPFADATGGIQTLYSAMRKREAVGFTLQDGCYYHYHGMELAPDTSTAFLRGIESVVAHCEDLSSRPYIAALRDSDKLFAMRALVEASNDSTAVVMGIQRLIMEVRGRPPEQWESILDHEAMIDEIEWMSRRCTEEQAKVRTYHSIVPLFAKYQLEKISPPLDLEQRVMVAVMERFEKAAVKKDPDKRYDYWSRLNGRDILIGPRGRTGTRHLRTR